KSETGCRLSDSASIESLREHFYIPAPGILHPQPQGSGGVDIYYEFVIHAYYEFVVNISDGLLLRRGSWAGSRLLSSGCLGGYGPGGYGKDGRSGKLASAQNCVVYSQGKSPDPVAYGGGMPTTWSKCCGSASARSLLRARPLLDLRAL